MADKQKQKGKGKTTPVIEMPGPSSTGQDNGVPIQASLEDFEGGSIQSMFAEQNKTLKDFLTAQSSQMATIAQSLRSLTERESQERNYSQDHASRDTNESEDQYTYNDNQAELSDILHEIPDDVESNNGEMGDELDPSVQEILNAMEEPKEFGPKLGPAATKAFQNIHIYSSQKSTLDEWKEKYKTPENCETLTVPAINPEVWTGLPSQARTTDVKWQTLQQHIVRSQIALAQSLDTAVNLVPKESVPLLLRPMLDASKSLSLAMQDINSRRKKALRAELKPEYSALCTSRFPSTKFLFGDELEKNMKDAKATTSILKSNVPSSFGKGRHHPYKPFVPRQVASGSGSLNFMRPPFQGYRGGNQRQFRHRGASQRPPSTNFRPRQ